MSQEIRPDSWRVRPPEPTAPRDWNFPPVERSTLPNGIRVVCARHNSAPLVSMRIVVHSGASIEPLDRAGLASLTAALLDEGAGQRDALTIAEDVARLGAFLGSGADWDASYISLDVLSKNLREGMEIVRDVLVSPSFDQEEIDRERERRVTTMMQQKDEPSFIAARSLSGRIYEGVRYGTPLIGTEETLGSIEREEILDHYRRIYVPGNVSIIVTGDVSPPATLALVREMFGDWHRTAGDLSSPARPQRGDGTRIVLVNRPGSVQSEIRIGHLGVDRSTEDYFPIVVMNALLGEVFNSRIMLNLRERHGYTYGARSSFVFRKHPGPFVVSTAVRSEVTPEAIREILKELERIRNEEISDEELEHARNYLVGVFPATVETANALANRIQEMELYSLPDDYFDDYREKILSVTSEDAARAAERYIDPESATIVIVGEARDLFDRLAELGHATEVLDIDGRPLEEW